MILFVNACVRENSRTEKLAEFLLKRLKGEVKEVKLGEISFPKVDEDFLKKRDEASANRDYFDKIFDFAKDFASADEIVIAAPFWDLSFPSSLKRYIEQITVVGLTFEYTADGNPRGLCKAKKIYYVTTAGGRIYCEEYGFGYVKALTKGLFGIKEAVLVKAEGLDIDGADEKAVLERAKEKIVEITA